MLRKVHGKPLDTRSYATYNRVTLRRVRKLTESVPGLVRYQRLAIRERFEMSFEVFEKLESKVQQAIDTITLLQMEIEELKEKNNSLAHEIQQAQGNREALVNENNTLKEQQHRWQERLQALLGKMDEV